MKRLFLKPALLQLLLVVAVLSSCKDNGPIISEDRNTETFSGVKLKGSSDVFISYDTVMLVRVETNEDVMEKLRTEVIDNTLEIWFDKAIVGSHRTKVYVHTPHLNKVILDGSGEIKVNDTFTANDMVVRLKGSGNISFPLNTNSLLADLDGSGNLHLSGSTYFYQSVLDGSGNINTFHLISDSAEAKISGSGNIDLFVKHYLDAYVNGSGDIRYRGNPAIVNSSIDGSGDIEKSE